MSHTPTDPHPQPAPAASAAGVVTGFAGSTGGSSLRRMLAGEGLSAASGLIMAAVLVVTLGAAWTLWNIRAKNAADASQRTEMEVLSAVLARSGETMLASGDTSAFRQLIIEAADQRKLESLRVVIPDGRVIADATPSRINLPALPERWSAGPVDDDASLAAAGVITRSLSIDGRGPATLELKAGPSTYPAMRADAVTCVALIAVAGLLAHWIHYRRVRGRLKSLTLIREALLKLGPADANGSAAAARIDPTLGIEAQAWNDLLARAERNRDLAEGQRARELLSDRRVSSNDLESAVDGLSTGIIVLDDAGTVRHANGAAAALLRHKRTDMPGAKIASLLAAPELAALGTTPATRKSFEFRLPGDLGDSVLKIGMRPLRRDDNGGVLLTLEDVTQQRTADASRNRFISQVTHELRAPLTNMRLAIEDALDTPQMDAATIAQHMNLLNTESRRLERIVSDMLNVSEIEAGAMKLRLDDVKLDRVLADLARDLKPQADAKNIKFVLEMPPKFPQLRGDRDKLMLAMHNLVGNAIKYTPEGGTVRVFVEDDAKQFRLSISDTGIGISAVELPKLFNRFYRAQDARVSKITGTGLGLVLSRDVARLHGGDVTVQSELDKGSTFTISLPIVNDAAPMAKAA
jgi:signal transduction histidine kinase